MNAFAPKAPAPLRCTLTTEATEQKIMFDLEKFIGWVKGGLLDTHPTWHAYKDEGHSWSATATQLSAPLIVIWGLLAVVFGSIFGTASGFANFIAPLISSAIWFGVGSFIASFFAAKFGGNNSFDQAFTALTFAAIPAAIGGILSTLPYIGPLFGLAGFVWSIMLLWQALPVFLDISLDRRTGHFFSTLGLSFVVILLLYLVLGAIGLGGAMLGGSDGDRLGNNYEQQRQSSERTSSSDDDLWSYGNDDDAGRSSSGSSDAGMFGFGREAEYIEAANEDRYTPPVSGKVDDEQVERTIKFLAAAERLRDASAKSLEKLSDENNEPSLSDLFKGVKGLVGAGTAEMQAVKSGGGNWAEHQWIKKQLFEGTIHQDLNDTTSHNYELYQEHEEALKDWL